MYKIEDVSTIYVIDYIFDYNEIRYFSNFFSFIGFHSRGKLKYHSEVILFYYPLVDICTK